MTSPTRDEQSDAELVGFSLADLEITQEVTRKIMGGRHEVSQKEFETILAKMIKAAGKTAGAAGGGSGESEV